MFRITEDPSSGSLVQCLAKDYKNDSIVSVDKDMVGVMTAYSEPLCVCVYFLFSRNLYWPWGQFQRPIHWVSAMLPRG